MNTLFTLLIRLRFFILPGAVVLFFFFGYHMHFIQQQSSAKIDNILSDDDTVLADYRALNDLFLGGRGGERIYAAFETDNVYTNDFLCMLYDLSLSVEQIDGVSTVTDIFSAYTITGEDESLVIEPFVSGEELPLSGKKVQTVRTRVQNDPFAAERLVNESGTATVLQITMHKSCTDSDKRRILNTVQNMLHTKSAVYTEKGHELTIHYAGDTIVQRAMAQLQSREDFIFPLMVGCLILVLLVLFRNIAGVIIPCAVMMISVTTTIGIKSLPGSPMSAIDPMLYALITTISVADSIHFVSSFYNPSLYPELPVKQRIPAVMKHSLIPCLLTTLTTAVGFGAIAVTHIPQTRHFGIFASAGVIIGFLYTLCLVPPMLFIFHRFGKMMKLPADKNRPRFFDHIVDSLILRLAALVTRHAKGIIITFATVSAVCIASVLCISTGTNPYTFLKDSHQVNRDLAFIEQHFSGISSVDIILSSQKDGAFKDTGNLALLDDMIQELETIEGVMRTDSIVKLIKQMNSAIRDNDDSFFEVPESGNLISQYLLLYEMSDDVDTLYTWTDSSYTTIRVRLNTTHTADVSVIRDRVNSLIQQNAFSVPVDVSITGSAVLWEHVDAMFISGQLTSLFLSITVISGILLFLFGSLRLGLFTFAVNLFPLLAGLGILGISGIPLSMGTVMIAPIAIGIAVDDSIHFMFRFKREQSKDRSFPETVLRVYRVLFRPIVFTSLILSVGFFSNMLSSFKPNAYFGLIAGIVILLAMIADLFLLPALIQVYGQGKS